MIIGKQRSMFNINVGESDHPYDNYRSTDDFIKRFVNQALINALKIIENMGPLSDDDRYGGSVRKFGYFGNKWPTYGNLNAQSGLESIIREMESWNALPSLKDWMFHATFIALEFKNSTEFYTYDVLWSVPTPAYPEPQVTVAVYFYIATSPYYPPHFPIDVTYCFEGHKFLHSLNVVFRPKWLYDILDMKTMMFKSFKF